MQRIMSTVLILILFFTATDIAQASDKEQLISAPKVQKVDLKLMLEKGTSKEKKARFFALLKPIIQAENQYIAQQRKWLSALNLNKLSTADQKKLQRIALQYEVETEKPVKEIYATLLNRVNTIPVELVLVQAANESAWGRSRFAQEANNLFGQWCFSKGCGVIPKGRPEGKRYEVAKFSSPQLSVRAYLHNLNTFWAYKNLRAQRAQAEKHHQPVTAQLLAKTLTRYSQRGQAYVDELLQMIKVNQKLINQVPKAV
ncbi:Bax protein [Oceanospirillum multiglobuliferum]|uniref:Mannosyl-glycoprotein endo-beta-N-acetylglucosamidase-like domain-containing protein n=2 Tax=Oceanospirillum multiglobuliferum TaxID=64969 RepID=A0A1T4N331_9GAMM|nr:hypothetical protein BTE48_06310 [Oceanospirillum multiglobuliferum]SJZ73467.1 Bax protein [Oceanospirillum multiglobuliferum]